MFKSRCVGLIYSSLPKIGKVSLKDSSKFFSGKTDLNRPEEHLHSREVRTYLFKIYEYTIPSVSFGVGFHDADTGNVQVIVAPKKTYGPGLQHVHIVFPVELNPFHLPNVVRMSDHKTPASTVLHSLVAAIHTINIDKNNFLVKNCHR